MLKRGVSCIVLWILLILLVDSSLPGMMFSGSCPTLSNIDALYLDIHAGELVRCVEVDISGSYPIKSVSGV